MKKSRSKFLKIVDEKHDINFHWPYTGCVKIKVIERQRAIVSELLRTNEIFSSSERSGF
jgi:hypothetical protein